MTKNTTKKKTTKNTPEEKLLTEIRFLISTKIDYQINEIAAEVGNLKYEISRLNDTIYEDRRVLADFVQRFMKDSRDFIDPNLAIDGGRKPKKND